MKNKLSLNKVFIGLIIILFKVNNNCLAQTTDSTLKLSFNGCIDVYYANFSDSVGVGNFQKFPFISSRNGFGLNIAMFSLQLESEKIRGTVSIHYGDIATSAWPSTFNPIMEAHAGVRIFPKLWLDAGFFKAHLGTESILPKENLTISNAVGSIYEASIESGFRLNYVPIQDFTINLYLLNGYNLFIDNNFKNSFGALITYNLNENSNIGYSNYIGDDTPSSGDSLGHLLLQQNLYFNSQVGKLKYQIGFDYAIKQNSNILNSKQSASMISGIVALKYIFNDDFSLYSRGEYFDDPNGIMSGVIIDSKNLSTGYKIFGLTAGVEYKPTDNSYLRLEGRQLIMDENQKIFRIKNSFTNSRFEILSNLGISF